MFLDKAAVIERFLHRPGGEVRAAVVYGPDAGLVRERAEALAKAATERPDDPFDAARLVDADLDGAPGRLEGELMAVSMMGGRRLVRLRLASEKASVLGTVEEALARHLAGELNPEAFFLIEAGELKRRDRLIRQGEASALCAVIVCYADEPDALAVLLREALAAEQMGLSREAMSALIARLPHDRAVARREIERLALFLGPRAAPAELDDLAGFFGVEPEASLADAAQDAFGGRIAAATAGFRRAAREGLAGPAAVRAMGLHLARLRRLGVLQRGGTPARAAARSAGVFWKNEAEVLRQARAWTAVEIERLQPEILAADRACKQTAMPDHLLAERLALAIAGRARRLGL